MTNMQESRYHRPEPTLTIAECVTIHQWAAGSNRFKNIDPIISMLSRFTLISRLKESKLKFREFIYNLKLVKYDEGEVVYNKATDERTFNLILYGGVSVYGYEHEGLKDAEASYIRSLNSNSYFGNTVTLDNIGLSHIIA